MITHTDRWALEIHYWQHVLDTGKKPINCTHMGYVWDNLPEGFDGYRETVFEFESAPSRADFLSVCRMLPWTHVWRDDLQPVIAANPWPMVPGGRKAASVVLLNTGGEVCGRLSVRRYTTYRGESYPSLPVGYEAEQDALKGLRGENRAKADTLLSVDDRACLAWERFSLLPYDQQTEAKLTQMFKDLLHEHGFIKRRKVSTP